MSAPDEPRGLAALLTNFRLALLLLVFILGWGAVSLENIPKERWPAVDVPIGFVTAVYPGAPADLVEVEVTGVLERAIQGIPDTTDLRSTSMESVSIVLVEFDVDADGDACLDELAERIEDAKGDLPDTVEDVSLMRVSTSSDPIYVFSLVGDVPEDQLRGAALSIRDRLERVVGVDEVDIVGLRSEEIQVLVDRHRIEQVGGTLSDVQKAIQNAQTTVPLGRLQSGSRNFPLDVGRVGPDLDALGALSVRSSSTGATVPLHSVASLQVALAEPVESTRLIRNLPDGGVWAGESLSFNVTRQMGADVPTVVKALEEELDEIRAGLPTSLELVVTTDRSREIEDGIFLLLESGYQAVLLVFLLLFLALGTRESLVAGLSIPITFLATFGLLHALGYSLNNLSLMALVIALGLLVDDFVLIMEGMHDELHAGRPPLQAAVNTVENFALPSLSGSLTTICAFLPLAMLGGLEGKFIQMIPLTICICLLVSYLVSVSLDTAIGAVFLRKAAPNRITAWVGRRLDWLVAWYGRRIFPATLGRRRTRRIVLGVALGALVVSLVLATRLDSIMYPETDEAQLGATVSLPAGTTLADAQRLAGRVEEQLGGDPDIDVFTVTAGRLSSLALGGPDAYLEPNQAEYLVGVTMQLVPPEQRSAPSFDLADRFRDQLAQLSAGELEIHEVRMGASSSAPIEVEVQAETTARAEELADEVLALMEQVPGVAGLRDSRQPHQGAYEILLRDEAVRFHGLDRQQVLGFLRSAISGTTVDTLYVGGDEIDIVLGYDWGADGAWNSPTSMAEVMALGVPNILGQTTPLSSLAEAQLESTPVAIAHRAGLPSVVAAAEAAQGFSPVEVAGEVEQQLSAVKVGDGETLTMGGDLATSQESNRELMRALGIAACLIFVILVMQFRSFVQPALIFAAMPLALIGVFVGFFVTGKQLSFPATIGIVALVGIVVNDAIVLIDCINRNRRDEGMPAPQAALEAGKARLRPILLTSMTTVIGLIPLALTDPVWEGLCLAIIYGISLATVLTLVVIPALYLEVARAGDHEVPSDAPPDAGTPRGDKRSALRKLVDRLRSRRRGQPDEDLA